MPDSPVVSPTLRFNAWALIIMFFAIVIGSSIFTTEIVARGTARVVTLGRTQTIQPIFDGKIMRILVHDGLEVSAGTVLV